MLLPQARGALSAALLDLLRRDPDPDRTAPAPVWPVSADSSADEALSLWVLQELHYRGFDDVDDRWEWDPTTIALRGRLERALEGRLRERYAVADVPRSDDLVDDVQTMIEQHDGPSLAKHVQQHASREQTETLLRQRTVYHLKEADPTTWVVPRLGAGPKAALLEVQFDEYGNGDPGRLHHALFERGLVASGLSATYGDYVDEALPEVLEQNTTLSMFGLQRRLRGAALGHLAAFEATSSIPSRQLAQGLRRLGFPEEMTAYYDEHVEADAVHEQVALRDVCLVLAKDEPDQAELVRFGAWACLDLECRTAEAVLGLWAAA
ncbi:iron-containing redox enzyme family protein [Nocardioides litoris]|uniref:iron-containing redox enzyme family protein n=1 Tax=Nocardioides litoris TaxID=1926648 RepID=UPI00111E0F05|nr:iron-containing redox enzyme family protein [Nocardioides litoris]